MAAESWCASLAYLMSSRVCSSTRVPNPVLWKGLKSQLTLHMFSLHCTEVFHLPLCHEILESLESSNNVELDFLLFEESHNLDLTRAAVAWLQLSSLAFQVLLIRGEGLHNQPWEELPHQL